MSTLITLALVFGQLSLLAFGGANSILPDLQRQVVGDHAWMTGHEFAALFALAQAAPGPNRRVVSLIGWRGAGLGGTLVATIGVALPSSVLTYVASGYWFQFRDRPWRKAIQAGLLPVTIGLVAASAALITATTTLDWRAGLVTAVAAGVIYFTKYHPLLILGGAAALGAVGLVG